jgi:hypothetical protein
MNFYYDPILGLQYNYLGEYLIIDVACIPEETIENIIKLMRKTGIMPLDASPQVEFIPNITNYKL